MRTAVLARGPSVPLDRVASTLGVTAPALLKRFGSRQNLLVEALRPPEHPDWMQLLAKGPTEERFEVQLHRILTRLSDFLAEVVPCMSALRESGAAPDTFFANLRGPLPGVIALQRWLAAAREKGLIKAVETESAAYALLGAIQTRALISHFVKQEFSAASRKQYLSDVTALFTRAVTTTESTPKSARGTRAPKSR
ncbi:MAG: TetR/AcrR family transcriptional regulator C-terminal domain-containing protein [Myxococcaceae bacterium]